MSDKRPRILIVGAGPAGLSAGVHLLEAAGGRLDVEIVSMGHHIGGKAASWRDADGYSIDHGFHAVFGFYEEMRSLARRAGVDLRRSLVPANGLFRYFDERSRSLEEFRFAHNPFIMLSRYANFPGLSGAERAQLRVAFRRIATRATTASLESLDDICYRAFLLQNGVPESALAHPMLREAYELAFNAPHEISTYIVMKWAQLAGRCYEDATYDYFAGGPSELFWDPIAAYFQRLGGTLTLRQKLVALEHDGQRLMAAHFGVPNQPGFHAAAQPWPVVVPTLGGSEIRREGFDAMICTLPAACFVELNPGDPLWTDPFFANIHNLTSVSTVSVQLWTREPTPGRIDGSIATLPLPLGYAIDYKRMVPEFNRDGRYGAALEWVGAEDGVEGLSDEEIVRSARAGLATCPGFEGTDTHEVVHRSVRRNRANHSRYLLTDPGTLRFRPTVETPLEGFFLAGDWVRNEIDGPSMEGAIRCGKQAARLALKSVS